MQSSAGKKRHNTDMESSEEDKPRSGKKRRTEAAIEKQSIRAAMRRTTKNPWAVGTLHSRLSSVDERH